MEHTILCSPLASLADLSLDAVCVADVEGHFVFVSAACVRLSGHTQQHMARCRCATWPLPPTVHASGRRPRLPDAKSPPAPMLHCATMLRFFKTCLILLLMTVVPLHAATAGIGLACASAMAPAASPPAVMAMAMAACHGQAAVPMPTTVEAAKHRSDSGASDQHAACSACWAACMGAFMPPAMPGTPPILAGAENVSIAAMVLPAGIIPDGLRRPPRRQGA